jgi:hypothetical protein
MIQVIKTLEELEALKKIGRNCLLRLQPRLLLKMAIISRMLLVEESWNFFLAWFLILCFRMDCLTSD